MLQLWLCWSTSTFELITHMRNNPGSKAAMLTALKDLSEYQGTLVSRVSVMECCNEVTALVLLFRIHLRIDYSHAK